MQRPVTIIMLKILHVVDLHINIITGCIHSLDRTGLLDLVFIHVVVVLIDPYRPKALREPATHQ